MSTEIYYFSGTGNSLVVARDIAEKTNGKLISIPSVMESEIIETNADVIGIVFPVYYLACRNIPLIVERFVGKLANIGSKYIFGVCTYGGASLSTIKMLDEMLKIRGGKLASGFGVHMPQNAFKKPYENKDKVFNNWKNKKLNLIVESVNAKKAGLFKTDRFLMKLILIPFVPLMKSALPTALNKTAGLPKDSNFPIAELISLADRGFHTNGECDGCEICARICPVNNIEMVNNRPLWRNHCENCLACYNWCPKKAIYGGISDRKGYHYHHPGVKVSDMFRQK